MKTRTLYSRRNARRERTLRRCEAMRAAKERKREARVAEMREVGRVTFEGDLFGGRHVMRLMVGEERMLLPVIDGEAFRPLSVAGLRRVLARRCFGNEVAEGGKAG